MKKIFNFYTSRSSKWTNVRKQHLTENNSCCGCGKKDKLEVHHIEPVHVNSNRELDPSNLVTLCKSCHFTIGHLMDWSSWNIDVVSDCRVYLNKVSNRPYKLTSQNLSFIQKIKNYINIRI
jgi:hypothetical protein